MADRLQHLVPEERGERRGSLGATGRAQASPLAAARYRILLVAVAALHARQAERRARRRRWAHLVRRVYETDPLICSKCGGPMRIISVILDPAVIRAILDHLRKKRETDPRAPPHATGSFESAS